MRPSGSKIGSFCEARACSSQVLTHQYKWRADKRRVGSDRVREHLSCRVSPNAMSAIVAATRDVAISGIYSRISCCLLLFGEVSRVGRKKGVAEQYHRLRLNSDEGADR